MIVQVSADFVRLNTKQKVMRSVAGVYNVGESEQQIIFCAVVQIKSNYHNNNDYIVSVVM